MPTIQYDPTPADQPEFSAEEQESLAIGEQMVEEQNTMLAGKYENAEQLEKAYLELQKQFSERSSEEPEEPEEQQEEEEEETEESDILDRLWEEATSESLSQETINELRSMEPDELAKLHLKYGSENQQPEAHQLTAEEAGNLKGIVGGDAEYDQMISWAGENLADGDIQMFDSVMEKGDPVACFFAIQALAYRFQEGTGFDGQMITGKTATENVTAYRSQAELVRDMSDPRYDKDPAYRDDVMRKLANSPDLM